MFSIDFLLKQPCPNQLAAFGCELGLHLSEDYTVTQKVFSRGLSPLQQSSVPPNSPDLPYAGLPNTPSLYQAIFMPPHLHGVISFLLLGLSPGWVHFHLSPQ